MFWRHVYASIVSDFYANVYKLFLLSPPLSVSFSPSPPLILSFSLSLSLFLCLFLSSSPPSLSLSVSWKVSPSGPSHLNLSPPGLGLKLGPCGLRLFHYLVKAWARALHLTVLALATLGSTTKIGSFLFFCTPKDGQGKYIVSLSSVAVSDPLLCQCKWAFWV